MRHRAQRGAPLGGSSAFVGGYLLAWTGFGIATFAALLVIASRALGVSDAPIVRFLIVPVALSGAVYQFTPLKRACLHTATGRLTCSCGIGVPTGWHELDPGLLCGFGIGPAPMRTGGM